MVFHATAAVVTGVGVASTGKDAWATAAPHEHQQHPSDACPEHHTPARDPCPHLSCATPSPPPHRPRQSTPGSPGEAARTTRPTRGRSLDPVRVQPAATLWHPCASGWSGPYRHLGVLVAPWLLLMGPVVWRWLWDHEVEKLQPRDWGGGGGGVHSNIRGRVRIGRSCCTRELRAREHTTTRQHKTQTRQHKTKNTPTRQHANTQDTAQNRTEQNRTEQNRTEQNRTE